MQESTLARIGAVAAVLGGLAWLAKGGSILVTGDQPPVVFALGPPLFAIAVAALALSIGGVGSGARRAAVVLAAMSVGIAVVGLAAGAAGGEDGVGAAVATAAGALSMLAALVLVGIAIRRAQTLPGRWRNLPLALGVATIPALLLGGLLATLSERLLEIPIVLFALAWIWIAVLAWPRGAVR